MSPREEFETRRLDWRSAMLAGVGGLGVMAALLLPIAVVGWSGLIYFLVGLRVRVFEMRTAQLRRRHFGAAAAAAPQ